MVTQKAISAKIDIKEKENKLLTLRNSLLDCCSVFVKNKEDWEKLHRMLVNVNIMLTDVRRKLGYMAVYPIVNGCAQESLFEGTRDECKIYTDILLEKKPEMKNKIIVLQL